MNPRFSMMRRTEPVDYPTLPTWQRDYYPHLWGTSEGMLKTGLVLAVMGLAGLLALALVDDQRK